MNWKFWTWGRPPSGGTLSLSGRLRIVEDAYRRGHCHLAVTDAKSALCGAPLSPCGCHLKLTDWMLYQNERTRFCGTCEAIKAAVRQRAGG